MDLKALSIDYLNVNYYSYVKHQQNQRKNLLPDKILAHSYLKCSRLRIHHRIPTNYLYSWFASIINISSTFVLEHYIYLWSIMQSFQHQEQFGFIFDIQMNINFVSEQSYKKAAEHLRLVSLRIGFRELQSLVEDKNKSPQMIQAISQFVSKTIKEDPLVNEVEDNLKKTKQLTFMQQKVRSSTMGLGKQELTESFNQIETSQQEIQVEHQKFISSKSVYVEEKVVKHQRVEHQQMQFGDIVIMKVSVGNVKASSLAEQNEMIVIGTQRHQQSLNCINSANTLTNNPMALQTKCFFKLVNPRQQKDPIVYGSRVTLQHIASQQFLQIQTEIPAQERGSFQVQLGNQNYQAILRLMPTNNSKLGDPVYYNHTILIQEDSTRQYYLKLENDSQYKVIDINAGDQGDQFFMQKIVNSSARLITLQHESQQTFSVTERALHPFIISKACIVDQETFSIRQLELNKFLSQEQEIYLQQNAQCIFEIQPVSLFHESENNACRLKCLFTQQYLSVDSNDEPSLRLTPQAKDDLSIFYLIPEGPNSVVIHTSLETYITYKNGHIQCLPLMEDQQAQQFEVKPLSKELSQSMEKISDIIQGLLGFHVYLQQWALIVDKRKQNEEILVYDHAKGIQQRPQLECEIQYFDQYLDSLLELLTPKEFRIDVPNPNMDMRVETVQQIIREQKILEVLLSILRLIDNLIYTSVKQRDKEKSRLLKYQRSAPTHQVCTVAAQILRGIPNNIYRIILASIKDNPLNRKVVLDYDELLVQHIRQNPIISQILKEAIRDSNIELLEWVKLLEPLDESSNNIPDMTLFLNLIALGLVDSNGNAIPRNQNKVSKELFSSGKNGKTKYLIQFQVFADKPTFNLYREEAQYEFLVKNASLSALHLIRFDEGNEDMFSLEELGEKIASRKGLVQIVSYLRACVNLLAELCRGRNKKSMKKVLFQGVTSFHIINVMKNQLIPLSLKTSYIRLYEVLFIDIDPFLELSYQSNFIWDNLQINDQKIVQLFNPYVEPSESSKLTQEFEEKMLPILTELLNVGEVANNNLIKTRKKTTGFKLNSLKSEEFKQKNSQKLKFISSLFHLIYKVIQLGYLTMNQIQGMVYQILPVLLPLMPVSQRTDCNIKSNWLSDLIGDSIRQLVTLDQVDEVFLMTGRVMETYFQLLTNVEVQKLVSHFRESFDAHCVSSLVKLKQEVSMLLERDWLNKYLFAIYTSNWPFHLKGFQACRQALQLGVHPPYMQLLQEVEIIHQDELQLYIQLTGTSLVGQIFSPIRLKIQIQQLEEDQSRKKDEGKIKDTPLEIDNQLNKLINRIQEMKINPRLLTKTQNILRNLGVHTLILKLMRLSLKNTQSHTIAIKFLTIFVHQNEHNASLILQEFPLLMQLASQNYKVSKLISNLQLEPSHHKLIFKTILPNNCTQFYNLLTALIQQAKDKNKIKREFLSNLFQMSTFVNDLQYHKQYAEIKNKKDEQGFYAEFNKYQAVMTLTSFLIKDYPQSQIYNVVSVEQIEGQFYNPSTPFIFKAELLKLMSISETRELFLAILQDLLLFPRYFEGLVKIQNARNEEQKIIMDGDKLMIEKIKVDMFDEVRKAQLLQQQSQTQTEVKRIVNQSSEYWDYIFSFSDWRDIQIGLLIFIQDSFDNLSPQMIIENDKNESDSLLEYVALIKLTLEQMKTALTTLERTFQIPKYNLLINKMQMAISRALLKCPLHLTNKLKINRLVQEYKTFKMIKDSIKFYKQKLSNDAPPKDQGKDNIPKNDTSKTEQLKAGLTAFCEKLRLYMLKEHITLGKLFDIISIGQFDQELLREEGQYAVESVHQIISRDGFCALFSSIIEEHHIVQQRLLLSKNLSELQQQFDRLITFEDALKYYDNYMQLRESQKAMDINKFYARLQDHISRKKPSYDKQQLKREDIKTKTAEQESEHIGQTFKLFVKQYELLLSDTNECNFYQLQNMGLKEIANEIKLDETLKECFNQLITQGETLVIDILHEFSKEQQHFLAGLNLSLQNVFEYFSPDLYEDELARSRKVLELLFKSQSQDPIQPGLLKFISTVLNFTDRLLNSHTSRDGQIVMNDFFWVRINSQKNRQLLILLKVVQSILRLLGKMDCEALLDEVVQFTSNYYNYISRAQLTHVSSEIEVLAIYADCLRVINNYHFDHLQLLPLLQFVISTQKYDLLSNNLIDLHYRRLFRVTIQLLLRPHAHIFYSLINLQQLSLKVEKFFKTIEDRQDVIIKSQICDHQNINCTPQKCQFNLLSQGEKEILDICFDVIILFKFLTDHHAQIPFVNVLQSLWQLIEIPHTEAHLPKELLDKLEDIEPRKQQKIELRTQAVNKPIIQSSIHQSPRLKFKESIYKITNKKNKVHQTLEEAVPFKKFEESESGSNRPSRNKLDLALIDWYGDAKINTHQDELKKQYCIDMARVFKFFNKFIGKIQIEGQIHYFQLPFTYIFLKSEITQRATQLSLNNDAFKTFQIRRQYFEEEVKFRQQLSQIKFINYLIEKLNIIKISSYFLVCVINVIYISTLNLNDAGEIVFISNSFEILTLVLVIIQFLLSLLILGTHVLNDHIFTKFKLKQVYKQKKFMKAPQMPIYAYLLNFETIYYIMYSIISLLSIFLIPFASVLLGDMIKRDQKLTKRCLIVLKKMRSIIQIIFLIAIIIYCYTFIAVYTIPRYYYSQTLASGNFYYIFLMFFERSLRLEEMLDDDHDENVNWGVFIFSLTLFIVVVVFFFASVFGSISSALHKHNTKFLRVVQKCSVCGVSKTKCAELQNKYKTRNISWEEHKKQHLLAPYLFFLTEIQNKPDEACTNLEKTVKQKLLSRDISWLPNQNNL